MLVSFQFFIFFALFIVCRIKEKKMWKIEEELKKNRRYFFRTDIKFSSALKFYFYVYYLFSKKSTDRNK